MVSVNKYTQDKLKDKAHGKDRKNRQQLAGSGPKPLKFYGAVLGLLLMAGAVALVFLGVPWYFVVGNDESKQREAHCTITEAYPAGSGGGIRGSSTASKVIIETQECGDLVYRGNLGTGSVDGAVDLLNAHAGEQVVFWLHPIQSSDWIDSLVQVKRVELP